MWRSESEPSATEPSCQQRAAAQQLDSSARDADPARTRGRLNQYNMHINLVERFGEPAEDPALLGMIARFKEEIIDARHSEAEAEVLLSTVCQAKGLEWDRVEVLNDCIPLDVMRTTDAGELFTPDHNGGDPAKTTRGDYKGDEVNSWFVACTRPKRELRLPGRWWSLVDLAREGGPTNDLQKKWWACLGEDAKGRCEQQLHELYDIIRDEEEGDRAGKEDAPEAAAMAASTATAVIQGEARIPGTAERRRSLDRRSDAFPASKKLRFEQDK